MSVYKRGDVYHYRFMVQGALYRGSTKESNAAKARKFESLLMAEVVDRREDPRLKKSPTLREFVGTFLEHVRLVTEAGSLDADTQRTYKYGWRLLSATPVADMRLDRIGSPEAAALRFPGSPSSANMALRTLRRILSHACQTGFLHSPPKIKLRKETGRQSTIDPWLEDLLLQLAPGFLADILVIMLDCGMRPEEIMRMRWQNVLWARRVILVPHGKSDQAERFVGITDRMNARLRNLQADQAASKQGQSEWVFPATGSRSGRKSASGHIVNVNKAWNQTMTVARAKAAETKLPEIPSDIVLYSARHTFATNFLAIGGDLAKLKTLMGHASITTTEKYLHPNISDGADLMNKHNRRRGLSIVKSA